MSRGPKLPRTLLVWPLMLQLGVAACAEADRVEDDRLVQAGFTKLPPTPRSNALLSALPPHRFVHREVGGMATVYYADPVACSCVYEGNEAALKQLPIVSERDLTAFDEQVSTTDYLQN